MQGSDKPHHKFVKVAFFRKSDVFFNFPNLQKKIFQKTILNLKFKFQPQDSFLEYIFLEIWRFEKQIALSERKPPLTISNLNITLFRRRISCSRHRNNQIYKFWIPNILFTCLINSRARHSAIYKLKSRNLF